jgi:hypothetical protein
MISTSLSFLFALSLTISKIKKQKQINFHEFGSFYVPMSASHKKVSTPQSLTRYLNCVDYMCETGV